MPGKHFIMADREDLIACCDYYLTHPKEAEAIAQAGSDFVRTKRRQAQTCLDFLRELESDCARSSTASMPFSEDARPASLPRQLSRAIRKRHAQQLTQAIAADLKNLLGPRGTSPRSAHYRRNLRLPHEKSLSPSERLTGKDGLNRNPDARKGTDMGFVRQRGLPAISRTKAIHRRYAI